MQFNTTDEWEGPVHDIPISIWFFKNIEKVRKMKWIKNTKGRQRDV